MDIRQAGKNRQTDRQTDRQPDGPTDQQTDRQAGTGNLTAQGHACNTAYFVSIGGSILVGKCLHGLPARRQLINGRQSHVPMSCERQSAGDGGGCHGQQMRQRGVLVLQLGPLAHPKPARRNVPCETVVKSFGVWESPAAWGEKPTAFGKPFCF